MLHQHVNAVSQVDICRLEAFFNLEEVDPQYFIESGPEVSDAPKGQMSITDGTFAWTAEGTEGAPGGIVLE